jgi:hypothetical protein
LTRSVAVTNASTAPTVIPYTTSVTMVLLRMRGIIWAAPAPGPPFVGSSDSIGFTEQLLDVIEGHSISEMLIV